MNIKKITAVLSLAAVMATSGSAFDLMNYNTRPNTHGRWTYGTTGTFGGGTVKSEYLDSAYRVSYSSVKNARGRTDSATGFSSYAKSALPAYDFEKDYSYYDYWN